MVCSNWAKWCILIGLAFSINVDNMAQDKNLLPLTEVTTSNKIQLITSASTSVQPNVLLRTGVFTPVGRKVNINSGTMMDLTTDLVNLELCQKEGYDSVTVRGTRLNVETDFKVWCGIVLVFSKLGLSSNTVHLKFSEFAKYCGYPSRRFDKNLRRQIGESLERIQSQSLTFRRKGADKAVHTGMLLKASYDGDEDRVELMADESLWDLYRLDYQVLVSMKVLSKLPRAEVAQCLYLYLLALPENPIPVSFTRLRERLRLESCTKEANHKIKTGLKKLESIGFLSGSFMTKNGEQYYCIDKRFKKLCNASDASPLMND